MSIRSRLVRQHNKKLSSKDEHSNNATDLSPITFCLILLPKLRGKISENS